jgi:phosphoglycolate phosphatase-like HAD superfamily hydrolase
MKLVLWDIDGTLVKTAGAGKRAVDRAFLELFGWSDATASVRMDGRTDPWIVDEVFRQRELPAHRFDEARRAVFARYVEHLGPELALSPNDRAFGPLPGIEAALEAIASRDDARQGLLTGNIEPGARRKLERFDLWRYFPFGAFGDDAAERPALLPVALARAEARFSGARFAPAQAVVVGDTPRDIEVGHRHGARTVAVATGGGYQRDELAACGPDHLFTDLSDTRAFLEAILA